MIRSALVAIGALTVLAFAPSESTAGGRQSGWRGHGPHHGGHHVHRHGHHHHHHVHRHAWRHHRQHGRGGVQFFIGAAPPALPLSYPVPPPVVYHPAPPPVWYFCASYGAYYPYVGTCPEGWVVVPIR